MASPAFYALPLLLTIQSSFFSAIYSSKTNTSIEFGVTLKLIHRFSPASPTYNPSHTTYDLLDFMEQNTANINKRLVYHQQYINAGAELVPFPPFNNLFLVLFSIGDKEFAHYTVFDTGSSMVWVKCDRNRPYYPTTSPSYRGFSCSDCDKTKGLDCRNTTMYCFIQTNYASGQYSNGFVGNDTFEFGVLAAKVAVPNVTFSCAFSLKGFEHAAVDGVFGIGPLRKLSFLDKLEELGPKKFSYCIGNVLDINYAFNKLYLGSSADIGNLVVPLHINSGHYTISVQCISLGQQCLAIDPNELKEDAILDTGYAYTCLPDNVYSIVHDRVGTNMDGRGFKRDTIRRPGQLCFIGEVEEVTDFPLVTFSFNGGDAEFALNASSLFYQLSGLQVFCMGMLKNSDTSNPFPNSTIIGLIAQQYYCVGYDLENLSLSIRRADCSRLFD